MVYALSSSLLGALASCACQPSVERATPSTADVAGAPETGSSSGATAPDAVESVIVASLPAQRLSPTAHMLERCGNGQATLLGEEQLGRMPYLQGVSATSAQVMFTTSGETPGVTLELTRPDGRAVQSVPAERDPADASGAQWLANLNGLEAHAEYCYALSDLTERVGFRTAPLAGEGATVRFVVFGDSGGGGETQTAVRDQLQTVPFDLMLHSGDIVYQSGTLLEFETKFFPQYAPLLGSIPIFPASGNHDYTAEDGAAFRQVFALPANGGPEGLERWYSFDWGDVHFVALDTQRVDELQIRWLDADLAQNVLPWTVVYMHRPPYSSGSHGSDENVRAAFSPLFVQHGVQVVFSGHDHDYERTLPLDGVTYVVTGGGGYGTRPVGHSPFTAYSEEILHFVYAEVQADSMLLHAIDSAGHEFDSVRLEQRAVYTAPPPGP